MEGCHAFPQSKRESGDFSEIPPLSASQNEFNRKKRVRSAEIRRDLPSLRDSGDPEVDCVKAVPRSLEVDWEAEGFTRDPRRLCAEIREKKTPKKS